jgi:glycosyltransferase involved in cell wall biosynthesis
VPGIGRRAAGVARGASLVRQALPLARKLRDLEADVVQSYVSSSIFVARIAAVLAGAPVRVSMPTGPLQLEWSLLRACDLRTLWLEQRVITGSGYTADLYRSYGVAEEKIASIPFGADPALFDRAREDTAAVRSELGVDADTPLVGNVAYFYGVVPEILGETFDFAYDRERGLKGQEDFVDAAKIVHDVRPDVRFVLVGGAWGAAGEKQLARVRQQVRELGLEGVVLFTGARPRVTDMLAALDVSVQCPVSDNYGGTFESLLMEAPTIGTAAGPIPEVIRHEQTGLLVPPADPEALAAAMLRLIEDPALARKLAAAGRQLVLDAFTTEQTVDRIDAVYRELAQRAGLDAPPLR